MSFIEESGLKPQLQTIAVAILQRFERGELADQDGQAWRDLACLRRPHALPASAASSVSDQWRALHTLSEAAEALEAALAVRENDIEARVKHELRAIVQVVGALAVLRAVSGVRSAADDLVWPLLQKTSYAREALALALSLAQAERIRGYTWSDGDQLLHTVDQTIARMPVPAWRRDRAGLHAQTGDLTELGIIVEVENRPRVADTRYDAARVALCKACINGPAVRMVATRARPAKTRRRSPTSGIARPGRRLRLRRSTASRATFNSSCSSTGRTH